MQQDSNKNAFPRSVEPPATIVFERTVPGSRASFKWPQNRNDKSWPVDIKIYKKQKNSNRPIGVFDKKLSFFVNFKRFEKKMKKEARKGRQ